MNSEDKKFQREYPHIYQLFQVAKAHRFGDYWKLKALVMEQYQCDVLNMTPAQAKELMYQIHYASPRKNK